MRSLLLLIGLACLAACGEGESDAPEKPTLPPGTCSISTIDAPKANVPRPLKGVYFGQEIWVSYRSKEFEGVGFRHSRERPIALHKARGLCRRVHTGEDIGVLARKWSNQGGAQADGFCAVPLPGNRNNPDARDIALFKTPVGQITPLIEWKGGFWFAKRISDAQGRALSDQLRRATKVRARARAIHIHHAGAFPRRHQFDTHPKKLALSTARWLIQELQRGVKFETLAKKWSNDGPSRERGGLLQTKHPVTKKPTEWIRWGDRNFSQQVLDVILRHGKPGEVWPTPVESGMGVDVVLVLERRDD